MIKIRKKNNKEKNVLSILAIIAIVFGLLWIFQGYIRHFLLVHVWLMAMFHSYLIGLIPESLYIKLFWDQGLKNPRNPTGKKRIFTRATFVIVGAIILFVGFIGSNLYIIPFLKISYFGIINSSFVMILFCGAWFLISIPLMLFVIFAFASPAGLWSSLKSLKKKIGTRT